MWIDNSFIVAQSSLSLTIYGGKVSPLCARASQRSRRCRTTPKIVALPVLPSPLPDVVVGWRRTRHQAVSAQGIARPSWNLEGNVGAPDRKPGVGPTPRRLRTQCHQWGFASSSATLGRSAGRAMDGR
jgi:hypothetical protein